jgi:3-oxoacyl-[acyl-carrier-protein] synthase-3
LTRADIDFLNVLHFKPSMYRLLLDDLGLTEEQAIYLDNFGHIGQVDQMLVVDEGLRQGRLRDGMTMAMLAAGIGYVWGATIVRWGPVVRA